MRFVNMNRLNSLSFKVLLAYVSAMVLSIALLVIAAVVALQSDALARMDLAELAKDMAAKIRFDGNGRPAGLEAEEDDFAWAYESLQRETAYRVLDEAGDVALLSSAGKAFWPAGGDALRLAPGRFAFERGETTMLGVTEPIEHSGKAWYFQVAASTRLMNLLHHVALPLVVAGIVVFSLVLLVALGLSAYITLRYTLKPLRDVSESAAAISPRSIHARLNTEAVPLEIAPLVASFNRVLERLEQGYRVQQEFLGNAAHELKTPLALIRAQIDLKEDGKNDNASLLGDVEYMSRQVQQLLLLAEASEVYNYQIAPVRLHEIADDTVSYLQRMAEAADVRLLVAAADDTVVWDADRGALFTLLKNLLENAIQHAPARTEVSVDIKSDAVIVRDCGPGVDAEQLPLLFERFWRGAHRRDHGAGLGLAICQEIALAHGWRLAAERAERGLQFRLSNTQGSEASP
ncbi:histidine kinase [Achromobacter sp. Root83]|uniref:sensor histidine kinase n=1 Tax=Achromobacter sp. Root83 TaxID=1736602 RepID=UPI0007096D02|nr:ATP-binding protein [Achromobacter sp. Root83]KRC68330.1 histidine kinase [Achromobacter sp. Root83]